VRFRVEAFNYHAIKMKREKETELKSQQTKLSSGLERNLISFSL
jgi:hypothetical protein